MITRFELRPWMITGALIALLWGGQALADDTDIYVTEREGAEESSQPNVLFIFDTSGSMAYTIETYVPYDPDTDYGDSSDDRIYVYSTDLENLITSIEPEQNNCQAMQQQIDANTGNPVWQGTAAFWKPDPQGGGNGGGDNATYRDEFDSRRYDNNDGSSNWSSDWTETNDDGDPRRGAIQVRNGTNDLRIRGAGVGIERTADLSGYDTASLSFYYDMDIQPVCTDYFLWFCRNEEFPADQSVSLIVNGTVVRTFDHQDGSGTTEPIDFTAEVGAPLTIEFSSSNGFYRQSGQDSTPTFFIDNVSILTTAANDAPEEHAEPGSWENLCGNGWSCDYKDTSIVECAADAGVHGSGDDDLNYAADASGPYTSNSSNAFDWNGIVDDRKYVSANYHDYLRQGTTIDRRKIDVMKDEAKSLVDIFDGINLGLMRFNYYDGGHVVHHFSDISDNDEKETVKGVIDELPASGSTPLTESLHEAMRYFRGESPIYAYKKRTQNQSDGVSDGIDPSAIDGATYNSPIVNSCQKNYIVLLSDGQPQYDDDSDEAIRALTGSNCNAARVDFNGNSCLDELAGYMANNDQSTVTGDQVVKTYTIGFDIDLPLLGETASEGQGKYYTVGDSKDLKDAFSQIIAEILDTSATFTAPAVTVNAYNNLQHRNELYYAMFKPRATSRWPGNIKRYQINGDGTVTDVTGAEAIDENTGFFSGTARSWWSRERDGERVEKGGVVDKLNSLRDVYVYTGAASPANVSLATDEHKLHPDNDALTNALLGLPDGTSSAARNTLINWARGYDVQNVRAESDYHNFFADPLHTRPAVVTYGGDDDNPDDVVFAMTNLGYLSAINTDDGEEIFSFIPKEVLPNLNKYFTDSAEINKVYGLDGHLTVWREESSEDADVEIEPADGDRVHLYFGMRRGGNHYYALDVTNRSNPKLMWQITGGSGDFADLGQTWSKPVLADVDWGCDGDGNNCSTKKVLIFGGGYDTVHDTAVAPTTDDTGAAVFMVDATNGNLLWSAGKDVGHDLTLTGMENSIPANVTTGDLDGDGTIDVMFALDIMGHLWRFDVNDETTSASDFVTGGLVADMSVSVTDADGNVNEPEKLRRFYNSPDVAMFTPRGQKPFFTASFGSGYRSKPKDEVITDQFYVVFLDSVFQAPTDEEGDVEYSVVEHDDLFDATSELANKAVNAPNGYRIDLTGSGEKAIADSLTFNGRVFFTTYIPDWSADACGVDIGGSRLYALDVLTGKGLFPNGNRSEDLSHAGIAADPVIIFTNKDTDGDDDTDDGTTEPILCVGTECFGEGDGDLTGSNELLNKTYWREQ
ncbi:hypothetical protein ACXYTJ_10685 [Gilvimarinus sp. F26214L]|uniref:hypothetical protein n=1 Tax=Gilvimarinus sp. DZF01 TaxID=3461371 RepID=UPI004046057D